MNHIHRLQEANEVHIARLAQIAARTAEFRMFLVSAKFTEPATDGSRTDWISTADVNRWLSYINEVVA